MVDKRGRRSGPRPELGAPLGDETILHVDMDAFYASVEVRDRPELAGRPVVVGGTGNRGVVAAASYEARRFGVFSAMPVAQARRLCPHGEYLSPDFRKYAAESKHIRAIFNSFTPLVEPISLDEAFLDVSGARRLFGHPHVIGDEIRRRIAAECSLPASVGCGTNKLIAKLASEAAKPNGLVSVPAGKETEFLRPLPVTALWGVGATTAKALDKVGIRTIGELADLPRASLCALIGDKAGRHLHRLANGRADATVVVEHAPKSVGHERTFETDLIRADQIRRELLNLGDRVGTRLRRAGFTGATITLKCRLASFKTLTRSRTLADATDTGPEIFQAALEAWQSLDLERGSTTEPIRLLGVSASNLAEGPAARQLTFEPAPSWHELMIAADAVHDRFGDRAVRPARLLGSESPSASGPVSESRGRRNGSRR